MEYGINLNIRHPVGQPQDVSQLKDVAWVRYVYSAAASHESIEQAFATYDPVVDGYNAVDVRSLLILNQETFWGHAPWNNGDWARYGEDFAAAITPIVQRYRGKQVAYEVWNEGDIRGKSSIYVEPKDFAPFLATVSRAIRANDPDAPIIFGGLAAGASEAAAYVQGVQQALGGTLPVDAIGIHPYGQWTPNFAQKPTWGGWFGKMDEYMRHLHEALPGMTFWMTEIGVSEAVNFPAEQYPMVQKFMQGVYDLLSTQYAGVAPVLMWFAWSDVMRQAGIVDSNNTPKGSVYEQFMQLARRSQGVSSVTPTAAPAQVVTQAAGASTARPAGAAVTVRVLSGSGGINVRDGAGTGSVIGSASGEAVLPALEELATIAKKIGLYDHWLQVRLSDGTVGWIAAWYVTLDVIWLETPATDGLMVRSGPDTSYEVVGSFVAGTPVQALEPAYTIAQKLAHKDDNWLQVQLPDGTVGWSYAPFLQLAAPRT